VYKDYLAAGSPWQATPNSVAAFHSIAEFNFVAVADGNGPCTANGDRAQVEIDPGGLAIYLPVSVPVTAVEAAVIAAPDPTRFALPGLGWAVLAAARRRVDWSSAGSLPRAGRHGRFRYATGPSEPVAPDQTLTPMVGRLGGVGIFTLWAPQVAHRLVTAHRAFSGPSGWRAFGRRVATSRRHAKTDGSVDASPQPDGFPRL
jgi:hypothetical protein